MKRRSREIPRAQNQPERRILKCRRCRRLVKEPAVLAGLDYDQEQISIVCHHCTFELEVFGGGYIR
jgi:hypothetical protein